MIKELNEFNEFLKSCDKPLKRRLELLIDNCRKVKVGQLINDITYNLGSSCKLSVIDPWNEGCRNFVGLGYSFSRNNLDLEYDEMSFWSDAFTLHSQNKLLLLGYITKNFETQIMVYEPREFLDDILKLHKEVSLVSINNVARV